MIFNWYTNNIRIRTKGKDKPPKGKSKLWNYRSVVGEEHKTEVNEQCKLLAEEKNEVDKKGIKFYQDALTMVVNEVQKDPEEDDKIHQLVDLWNTGPPPHIKAK